MTEFVLIGGGAWAREIVDWFADAFETGGHKVLGFLQDDGPREENEKLSVPYIGPVEPTSVPPGAKVIMAVAKPRLKAMFGERFPDRSVFASLVHPRALVSRSASLGHGVVLAPCAVVSAHAKAGDFVTVNLFSSIGHDVVVGPYSTLSSYVDLTGGVTVGAHSFWGSGARAIPAATIGDRTTIGAGSVVMRNIPDGTTVYTMPARPLTTESPG